jgi:hypothetical protein
MANQSKTRPSKLKIDERTFVKARGETNEKVARRVVFDLRRFGFYGRADLVGSIARHQNLPVDLLPIYPPSIKFHGMKLRADDISSANYPYWIIGIFRSRCKLLKQFLVSRTHINSAVLKGDADDALQALYQLNQLSRSWWSIETEIHVTKELLGQDTKALVNGLRDLYPHLNLSISTSDLVLLSESSSVSLFSEKVLGRIKEYKNANIEGAEHYGDLESMSLLPLYYDSKRAPSIEALHNYFEWSIFDQYLLFRTIVMENQHPQNFLGEFFEEVLRLAKSLDDWELLNILVPHDRTGALVDSIVKKYTFGDYEAVVQQIQSLVQLGSTAVYGLLELYARAKIYSGASAENKTFYDRLANELGKILTLDQKSIDRTGYLHRIAVKFRKEAWAKSLLYHLAAIQKYRTEPDLVEVARRQTLCLGELNSPKANGEDFNPQLLPQPLTDKIPQYRLLKHGEISTAENLDPAEFPIYSDFLLTRCDIFSKAGLFWESVSFYIDEYLKSRVAFAHLPFDEACRKIEEMNRDEGFDHLAAMVVLDIYDRESDGRFDELRTDIFLEYLDTKNTHMPSKIFRDAISSPLQGYFLEKICIPAQLDNIIQFESYDDVIHERVAIIDILIADRAGGVESLAAERDKVLETLFSEKLRAKIETGKLYVDVQALENQRKHVYLELYERARSIGDQFVWEPINSTPATQATPAMPVKSFSQTELESAKATGEKATILATLYLTLAFDFALNQKFGLDKYLSAEVRHQIFVPQLRACFEKNRLVTVQKHGEYLTNDFWRDEYNFVSDEIIGRLDEILKDFSEKIDKVLSRVNDSFKVWIADEPGSQPFDFSPTPERLMRLAKIVNSSTTFEVFFNSLIGFMLELAVDGARAAQQLINETLLPEVSAHLDTLEAEINNWKGSAPLFNLMQAIRNARSDFTKEVEVVLPWFRFVGSENLQTFESLGTVIEAAVSSFRSIFEHKGKTLTYNSAKTDLIVNYREARSLFISLFIALENALRYGCNETAVSINHKIEIGRDLLVVANRTGNKIEQPEDFVRLRREEWENEFSPLSNQEGGTGLYKMNSLLTGSSPGLSFDISVSDFMFNALISLNHEYFSHRRQSA